MRRRMGRPGLIGTMARTAVVAGTASAVVGGMSRHSAAKTAAVQQQQDAAMQSQAQLADLQQQVSSLQSQQAVPAQATGAESGSMVAELERLASLKTAGILSDGEFQAAKAKLLS
jgi:uncharacterized protein YlxW (UPF0749 family)